MPTLCQHNDLQRETHDSMKLEVIMNGYIIFIKNILVALVSKNNTQKSTSNIFFQELSLYWAITAGDGESRKRKIGS